MVNVEEEIDLLAQGKNPHPHSVLGLQPDGEGRIIRLWRPGEEEAFIELFGKKERLERIHEGGVFALAVPIHTTHLDYRVTHPNGLVDHDPYAFLPTFMREDEDLFAKGEHEKIFEVKGGRVTVHQECQGVKFSVWAPCAEQVTLVADFNHWNDRLYPMRLMGASGVWELFIPGLTVGELYKYAVRTKKGHIRLKADPYAFQGEVRPKTASCISRVDQFGWQDGDWMERRAAFDFSKQPLNIYEIHFGSWKKGENEFPNYREIAPQIANYCQGMGYTHVEIMPIQGHPLDESWGYQVTGFYAISRRYGSIEDFQYLVDYLHRHEIGVILDWVPGHFPTDDHSIAEFDGTYLYEHEDPRQGYHPHWNTHIFNYGRHEVSNFLFGSALFYFEKMHIDGLRVDAVSSMVYLDFGRREGEWIPNENGGNENLEAIAFLRKLNMHIHEKFPGVIMIAEESHAFPGVTSLEGLGFDMKWNMGWMNDILRYFQTHFPYRHFAHKILVHAFTYCFTEKFILALSHDEVVHHKKSLLSKMPGNEWEKFAGLRLLLSYMTCHPGKQLLFMGGEIGQWGEWQCHEEIHWELLQAPYHEKLQTCACDLNHFYLEHPALWEIDFSEEGFKLVDYSDEERCILSYLRIGRSEKLLCIHHFSPNHLKGYFIPYAAKRVREIFTTDLTQYGGYGIVNSSIEGREGGFCLDIAPLSTIILDVQDE
jgi:1,4-alpha-glucan branching enzyme